MKKFFSYILLNTLFLGILASQTTVKVDLQKHSWLAINGTSNILSFKLIQNGDRLLGKSIVMTATQNKDKIYLSQNQLSIDVKKFTSNNPMALRDFLKLVKSESYPTIKAELSYIETLPGECQNIYAKGKALVNITITGITHQYTFPISSNKVTEYISVTGGKKINIRDFGLEPPNEMLGMLKVSEWINIDFNLICKFTNGNDIAKR